MMVIVVENAPSRLRVVCRSGWRRCARASGMKPPTTSRVPVTTISGTASEDGMNSENRPGRKDGV